MKISSKLKKIISFMLVLMLMVSSVVLPVSADETTTQESEHDVAFDMSTYPEYKSADLEYTGEVSENVRESFNIRKEYDMQFTKNDYYICRPFTFDYWQTIPDDFSDSFSESWLWQKIKEGQGNAILPQELDLNDFDVYYIMTTGRNYFNDHNLAYMTYYLVPHGAYIAFSNDSSNNVGVYVKDSLLYKNNGGNVAHSVYRIERGAGDRAGSSYGALDVACDNHCFAWSNVQLVASNIPVFDYYLDAVSYLDSQPTLHDPHGKVPEPEQEEKVGADAFYWDSLKCRISQQGQVYNFVYDYSYSVPDMVAHPEEYTVYTDYSQVINYRFGSQLAYDNFVTEKHSSFGFETSVKTAVDSVTLNQYSQKTSFGTALLIILDTVAAQKYVDTNFSESEILSAYIYVTVTLVHTIDGGNGLSVKDKVSSDVRTFKFDATTLESLDSPEEIKSDVKVDDVKDENGKVIDRTVSQVVTNDHSTHQTINNYYYDSDGNRKESSGSSIGDSLSDIASGLIKFIKTLVTEGLPAALEILKSLIKTISDLLGFIGDQIGDIGQGTQNGIIAVLKAIPVPLWGICSVGIIAYVIVGVVKKFF